MNPTIQIYNNNQNIADQQICNALALMIDGELQYAESKIWHSHPVWFLNGNPIVGYSKEKAGIRLMFWSGADFNESILNVKGEKFKDASIFYKNIMEIKTKDLQRCLKKAITIQWDYKNLVKRKGELLKLQKI